MEVVAPMPSASVRTVVIGERRGLSQAAQGVTGILYQSFQKREPSLISIAFLDRFHGSELQRGLTARLCGRQTGAKILGGLHGEMFFNFGPQAVFILLASGPGSQAVEEAAQGSHWRSSAFATKKRPMMAAVCSQSLASARSCLRPSRVRR